ncbi:hybrid-cluster NAD(P)-dependent oxidoreductase [Pararhizobium sp. BT-229]|uniref:hybrid-cluster NAD(P)-dependent oxidoreductase n=1 Tax=Pararhizobium sp. BT-229 TaxID=2986923 RepID=UPI0021F79273|nr:hybrid-cluster NAD(P)-dependent oxidoreductase [Pararhizobium sp. BT-229]MCV9961796.1 hybrid-cluster NAD(P)-dependent oxidoreductase [Pararhizobium sp. BT-229]
MDTKVTHSADLPVDRAYWNPDVDNALLCIDVHQETHDVKTFTFVSRDGKHIAFSAGQYFAFDAGPHGDLETRCYSISSSPLRPNAISITVKRVAGGKVSNWLHDNLAPGAMVQANGPLGQFIRPGRLDQKYLFLSGGSGITPVMAMARELADAALPVDVIFLHAGRSPGDLVFRSELTNLATRLKGFRLYFLPETLTGETSWSGLSGRISHDLFQLIVPDLSERIVMCCGPAPFMAAARMISAELGVPMENYIEESFDAAVIGDAPLPLAEQAEHKCFKVEFAKQGRTINVTTDQTVLSCAKKAGVKIPSSCSNGLCGTCKSKLASGTVDMKHNGGIRQREIDAGFFLPCCSKPLSDLVIER